MEGGSDCWTSGTAPLPPHWWVVLSTCESLPHPLVFRWPSLTTICPAPPLVTSRCIAWLKACPPCFSACECETLNSRVYGLLPLQHPQPDWESRSGQHFFIRSRICLVWFYIFSLLIFYFKQHVPLYSSEYLKILFPDTFLCSYFIAKNLFHKIIVSSSR